VKKTAFIVLVIIMIVLSACTPRQVVSPTNPVPIEEDTIAKPSVEPTGTATTEPTKPPTMTSTTAPTETATVPPTSPPTSTPTQVPCNDLQVGDLTDPGNPVSAVRVENPQFNPNVSYPLKNSLSYNQKDYHVFTREMHNRLITVAVIKDKDNLALAKVYANYIFDTWATMWNIVGGFPFTSYTVVARETRGCPAFQAFSFGSGFELANGIKDRYVTAHEIFHSFAHFYIEDQSWLQEGLATYYGARLADVGSSLVAKHEKYQEQINAEANQYLGNGDRDVALTSMTYADPFNSSRTFSNQPYHKGAMVYYLLDAELKASGHNLDEVVRELYQRFGVLDQTRYITVQDLKDVVDEISGKKFDDFFSKYIYGNEPLPVSPGQFVWICHDNNPAQIPLPPAIPQDTKFAIDGKLDDWAGITPLISDVAGDADTGQTGDLTELYSTTDEKYLYIMLKAGKKPQGKNWFLDFFVDTVDGGTCPPADRGIQIYNQEGYSPFITSRTLMGCGDSTFGFDPNYHGARGLTAWDEVFEAALPLYLLEGNETISIQGASFNMDHDGSRWWMNSDVLRASDFPFSTLVATPVPREIPAHSLPIKFDGKSWDWATYKPVLTDPEGDSILGPAGDLVAVYQAVDNQYLYIMIQAKEPIIASEYNLDIFLDLNNANTCSAAERIIGSNPSRGFMGLMDYENCEQKFLMDLMDSRVVWSDVIEIMVPLANLGGNNQLTITGVKLYAPVDGKWQIREEVGTP
jgi:hypothetical protein